MKKEFASTLLALGKKDPNLVFITGDLGFNAFEEIIPALGERFINAGVAEQNMASVAAGMASEGIQPWIYSIAPFLILKTVEQLRNDICHMKLPVKFIGNGGGFGYGIMGATHHLLEDIAIVSSMPGMHVYIPSFSEDVEVMMTEMHKNGHPCYLRLGVAPKHELKLPPYTPFRHIKEGSDVTVVAVGPLVHHALAAQHSAKNNGKPVSMDIWNVCELPFTPPEEFYASLDTTGRLFIYEEHVKRGGVGESLLAFLSNRGFAMPVVHHYTAEGYPSQLYGDQQFHLKEHGLHAEQMAEHIVNSMDIK